MTDQTSLVRSECVLPIRHTVWWDRDSRASAAFPCLTDAWFLLGQLRPKYELHFGALV
jgi:hypothetical protein